MSRFADPQRCPNCRKPLDYGAPDCRSCGIPLAGPVAGPLAEQLFATLVHADELIEQLRSIRVVPAPAAAVTAKVGTGAAGAHPHVAGEDSRRRGFGLSAASVPKVLLALGALCILVAGLVFLAVTWSVMGVSGRTATLLIVTAVAGGVTWWVARRGLGAAAESLSVVSLGLVAFDLAGADSAGWLGNLSWETFLLSAGGAMVVAAVAVTVALRRTAAGTLVSPQLVTATGLAVALSGWVAGPWLSTATALMVAVLAAAAVTLLLRMARLGFGAAACALVTTVSWTALLMVAVVRGLEHPTAADLYLRGEGWPLLVSALLVAAVAALPGCPTFLRNIALTASLLVALFLVLLPFSARGLTPFTIAVCVVLLAGSAMASTLPSRWVPSVLVPMTLAAGWVGVTAAALAYVGLSRAAAAGRVLWGGTPGGVLPDAVDLDLAPWVLPLAVASLLAAAALLSRSSLPVPRRLLAAPAAIAFAAMVLAAVLTTACYAVPVWSVMAMSLVAAATLTYWALMRSHQTSLAAALVFLGLALGIAVYDEWLTAVTLAAVVVLSASVVVTSAVPAIGAVGGASFVAATGGLGWTVGALVDASPPVTALACLVGTSVVGLVWSCLAAPRDGGVLDARLGRTHLPFWVKDPRRAVGGEAGAVAAALLLSEAGITGAAAAVQPTWAAVYLTVTGAAVTAVSLVRSDRARARVVGGLLLAGATWVRLWDIGVTSPEPYTLPAAVVLLVTGLIRMRRQPSVSTMAALGPGLALALTPSLLWAVWQPLTLRSVLLGAACLGLVALALRYGWTAPLVFAVGVGTVLVVRHATPLADAVERWVLIGGAGAILTAVGITWEQRLREARAVVSFVRELR